MKENPMEKKAISSWKTSSLKAGMVLAASIVLAACGGGGGGGGGGSGDAVLTGQFLDAAVEGLGYSTPTQSGKTDGSGRFKYVAGETVAFTLYGQPLSSSIGFSTLTPSDTGVEDTDLDQLVNQLRFLQTIDADNDPSNGISLPIFSGVFNVDFSQRIEAFENDAAVQAFLTAHASGRPLVSVPDVIAHFSQSIGQVAGGTVASFAGKTATSVITNTACINSVQAQQRYAFGPTSVALSGSDGFVNTGGNCVVKPDANEVVAYSSLVADEFLSCLPDCAYKDVNGLRHGLDGDGRTVVELSWHTPGTNKVRNIKRILHDPLSGHAAALSTFKETLTFD
ncbi:hypothetical protein [Hydrogenophaga palleronii]|uniref:hypothetical protein n=1 Tax=Hydrogenophaga palleronii TaxID=65655 RepID=UPI000A3EFEBE|nr:hypothetical protein [Hydrogenophaga palleronii]